MISVSEYVGKSISIFIMAYKLLIGGCTHTKRMQTHNHLLALTIQYVEFSFDWCTHTHTQTHTLYTQHSLAACALDGASSEEFKGKGARRGDDIRAFRGCKKSSARDCSDTKMFALYVLYQCIVTVSSPPCAPPKLRTNKQWSSRDNNNNNNIIMPLLGTVEICPFKMSCFLRDLARMVVVSYLLPAYLQPANVSSTLNALVYYHDWTMLTLWPLLVS